MKIQEQEFEVLVPKADGSGIAEKIKVMVPVRWDEEAQAWLMTPEAHEIVDNTKARLIGLLLPAQFRELRERYGFPQKAMGELFQVGEKSWTRWESGKQRPSRSINLLIRALYEGEISINYLLKQAGKPPKEDALWSAKIFNTLYEGWHSSFGLSQKRSPDLVYLSEVGHPVFVQCKASPAKQSFVAQLVELVNQQSAPSQDELKPKGNAWNRSPCMPTPTHTYTQPRLSTPTEVTEG